MLKVEEDEDPAAAMIGSDVVSVYEKKGIKSRVSQVFKWRRPRSTARE